MNVYKIFLVGAGGFVGSVARYLASAAIDKRANAIMPWGTLTVNLAGSFLLGVLVALLMKKTGSRAEDWRLLIGTGFCGGFTTFSTFALENASLLEQKLAGSAMYYVALSLAGGFVAVWAGLLLGRHMA